MHLAEHCRAEYSRVPNFILWVIAEIAIVACDIPEGIMIGLGWMDCKDFDFIHERFLVQCRIL